MSEVMSGGRHMLWVLVVASFATAGPAHAATPVSDQYQSAPPPVVKAAPPSATSPSVTAAPAPAAAPGASAPAPAPATGSGGSAGAEAPAATPKAAPKPLVIEAVPADGPLAAPESDPPIGMLAVVGVLALALGFAAVRGRRAAAGA
jgi:hypothetical protein